MKGGFGQRIADFVSLFVMGILSLGLLAYIGYGEARQNYPKIEFDRAIAQARPFQFAIEKYLDAGLPLKLFAGFEGLVRPVLSTDDAVDSMAVLDRVGAVVFQMKRPGVIFDEQISIPANLRTTTVLTGPRYTQVIIPLRSKFGFGGHAVLHLQNQIIDAKIDRAMQNQPWVVLFLSVVLGLVGTIVGSLPLERRAHWDKIAYIGAFLLVSAVVIVNLTGLYSEGVRLRAVNLGSALAERLQIVYDLGLSLDDIEGVDQTLASYRGLNPDLGNLAMIVDGQVLFHTEPAAIGKALVEDRDAFGVLLPVRTGSDVSVRVYASIPYAVVVLAIGRSAKTFAVLLVASAFVAGVFYQLGGAVRRLRQLRLVGSSGPAEASQSAIEAIKPVLFMGFFVENMAVSFLPQWMQASAVAGGLPAAATSVLFMAYFVAFAAVLAPAGLYAGRRGPKPLILGGAVLVALSAITIASSDHYLAILLSRLIAGVGQGVLFIGGQSYVLAYSSVEKRTQSANIIVYSFNGGMLSGMAIGALLVGYLSPVGVFWLGAAIIACAALYTWLLVTPPPLEPKLDDSGLVEAGSANFSVFRERGFLWATLLVGIPTKMILTGVIIFSMPLILSGMELEQQNIGQVIMFYAIGVLIASHLVSRFADRFGRVREILFAGMCLCAIGLVLIGMVGLQSLIVLGLNALQLTIMLLLGVFVVGIGHGFINAPIITYVGATVAAQRFGEAQVTAFYRLIERVGHIGGPLIVGQLYFFFDQSPIVIAGLGGMILLFAALFLVAPAVRSQTIP